LPVRPKRKSFGKCPVAIEDSLDFALVPTDFSQFRGRKQPRKKKPGETRPRRKEFLPMSYDLVLNTATGAIARDTRRAARDISRIQADGQIRQAAVDTELEVATAKEDTVTTFTMMGMGAMARVGQAENTVVLNLPSLSGRIAGLAERHTLATYEIHDDLTHRVRRR
jgi:hypothetical protein